MRLALLQSAALLTGVSPIPSRPAIAAPPASREAPSEAGPGRVERPGATSAPRRPDELWLSPAALRDRPAERAADADEAPADRSPGNAAREPAGRPEDRDGGRPGRGDQAAGAPDAPAPQAGPRGRDGEPLSEREQRRVAELKARDQEVRTHEQAHKAVGGRYAGAINYEFTDGPDGGRYATGGSVSIDASPIAGDPEATIAKMRIIRAAALAPAEPSSADRSVAAQADRTSARASQDMARERREDAAEAAERADGRSAESPGVDGEPAARESMTPRPSERESAAPAGAPPAPDAPAPASARGSTAGGTPADLPRDPVVAAAVQPAATAAPASGRSLRPGTSVTGLTSGRLLDLRG